MPTLSLLLAMCLATGQEVLRDEGLLRGPETTHLDLRVSPIVDLYMLVRCHAEPDRGFAKAEGRTPPPAPEWEGFAEAVAAARVFGDQFRSTLSWGAIDPQVDGCVTGDDLVRAFGELPETMFDGRLDLREPARVLAQRVADLEEVFLAELWPVHQALLEAFLEDAGRRLLPVQDRAYAFILDHFHMKDPRQALPVYLCAEMPAPGGVTFRSRDGGGLSFVGIGGIPHEESFETILHETMHGLDVLTRDQQTSLVQVAEKLRQTGVPERDRLLHDVPHLMMFVTAAEAVRRFVSADHVAYGEVTGLYDRLAPAGAVVVPLWKEALALDLTAEEAMAEMAASLADS